MIRKTSSPDPGFVRVTFELPSCVWADRIFLTGDFSQWDQTATPMRQNRNGVWQAIVDLPVGQRYEFRYLIDGQWRTDNHADGFSTNIFGSENSIVITDLPESQEEPPTSLIHENRADRSVRSGPAQIQTPKRFEYHAVAA